MTTDDLSQEQIDQLKQLELMAQVGKEAEGFRNSRLGQWMIDNARGQKAEVIEALLLADPTDAKAVAELQGKAVLLGMFEEMLNQAIAEGVQATQFLQTID